MLTTLVASKQREDGSKGGGLESRDSYRLSRRSLIAKADICLRIAAPLERRAPARPVPLPCPYTSSHTSHLPKWKSGGANQSESNQIKPRCPYRYGGNSDYFRLFPAILLSPWAGGGWGLSGARNTLQLFNSPKREFPQNVRPVILKYMYLISSEIPPDPTKSQ